MKQTVIVDAYAKLNLSLDITGVRPDGYHELETIMQSIDLCDTITVSRMSSGSGIYISCDKLQIPCDETNFAHKAAQRFFEVYGAPGYAISIDICKRIPSQAGMGGGSADAAGVIAALDILMETHAAPVMLGAIALKVGADVPFCLHGGTCLARGIGEQLQNLPQLSDCYIVVAKPQGGISTVEAYQRFDRHTAVRRPDTAKLQKYLGKQNLAGFAGEMCNVFEEITDIPEIPLLKEKMLRGGALGASMSGSGSAVFGIYAKKSAAKHDMRKLYDLAQGVFLARPVKKGVQVVDVRD